MADKYRCHVVKYADDACAFAEPFWQMQDEGLDGVVMYDSAQPNIVDWNSVTNSNMAWLIRIEDAQGNMVAIAWVNSFMGRCAMIHFCVFKAGRFNAVAIGRTLLGFVFKSGKLDALMGITPATYRHALSFVEKLGFVRRMVLPKACHIVRKARYVDGIVTLLQRDDFMKGGD
ncbi:MAG: hypothetical protein R3Y11_03875 [Pseudomonadota bacterium]